MLSYDTYLYRVGIRERILFTQHENTIIVIDIGETQEIVSKITRKIEAQQHTTTDD